MLNFMLSLKLQLLESVDDAVQIPVLFSEQRKEVWKCSLAACSLEAKVATNPEFLVFLWARFILELPLQALNTIVGRAASDVAGCVLGKAG